MRTTERLKAAFGSVRASDEEKRKARYRIDMHRASAGRRRLSAFVQAACACTAAAFALLFFNMYRSETAYISLDVNPSIALAINDFGRVIEATGYGPESDAILESVQLPGLSYEAAVSSLLDAADMQPYLASNGTLWISVQAKSPVTEMEMEQTVRLAAENALAERQRDMEVASGSVTEEVRVTAEDAGVSATRYIAIIELQEVDPGADLDSYKDAPIHDIHEETAAHILEHTGEAALPPAAQTPAAELHPPEAPAPESAAETAAAADSASAAPPPAYSAQSNHHGSSHHYGGHH